MASFEQIIKFESEQQTGGASPPGEPLGGARRPAEPRRLAGDGSPYLERLAEDGSPYPGRLGEDASPHLERLAEDGSPYPAARRDASPYLERLAPPGSPGGFALPVRRKLPHGLPPFPVKGPVIQFVTVNAAERGGTSLLAVAEKILAAARFYHEHGRWFLYLFLIMPDHLHMLATFPSGNCKATCGVWKGFLRKTAGVCFQSDCFEHRIRNESELAEKWHYIRENPVRKGLVGLPDEWPLWIAFDPATGRQTGGANPLGEPLGGANPLGEPPRLGGTPRPTLNGSAGRLAPPWTPRPTL